MQHTKKLLSITNLKKYFPVAKSSVFQKTQQYVRANEDISLDIYEGETIGVVGESGCGKSTLGRVLLQLYPQTAGSTMYYGKTLAESCTIGARLAASVICTSENVCPRFLPSEFGLKAPDSDDGQLALEL